MTPLEWIAVGALVALILLALYLADRFFRHEPTPGFEDLGRARLPDREVIDRGGRRS